MVTGDNIFTAKAIAQECGILEDKGLVVEGKDFRTWDAVQLDRDLKHLSVMARSSPTDKLKLVQALQARRNVVAVTGDGTNDAPALHAILGCPWELQAQMLPKRVLISSFWMITSPRL
jgi:Ca2+-transporting ATPase